MTVLQVIQPASGQDCSRCRHIFKCRSRRTAHDRPLSDRNDTINLLVCRLKLGINVDESAKSILQMMRPGMVNLVAQAKRRAGHGRVNFDNMLMDMQSFTIESIMVKYRIGELNPVTNFLFDPRSGYLTKWSKWYVTKILRWEYRNTLMEDPYADASYDTDDGYESDDDTQTRAAHHAMVEMVDPNEPPSMVEEVMEIIEDGVTLNANEYRVLKFSLQNANEGNSIRMVDGLHIHQAARMRVSRPRATRLFKRAKDKLRTAYEARQRELTDE